MKGFNYFIIIAILLILAALGFIIFCLISVDINLRRNKNRIENINSLLKKTPK
jgi:hypothetical protein